MPLHHACFVSYRHSDSEEVRQLVKQVHDELKTQLALLMQQEPYWDEKLYTGAQFRGELAQQLVRSICMVVLYSPVYCQSSFCRSEFHGMLKIQEERLRALGKPAEAPVGMIVPIILKKHPRDFVHDREWLPEEIQRRFHYCDISQFILRSTRKLRSNPRFRDKMKEVADAIESIRVFLESNPAFENGFDWETFTFPDSVPQWPSVSGAAPPSQASASPPPGMPAPPPVARPMAPFPLR